MSAWEAPPILRRRADEKSLLQRIAGFLGGLLLFTFFVFCLLTALHGGDVIGPLALLTGQPSFWDVPIVFGMFALGAWMILRIKPPRFKEKRGRAFSRSITGTPRGGGRSHKP